MSGLIDRCSALDEVRTRALEPVEGLLRTEIGIEFEQAKPIVTGSEQQAADIGSPSLVPDICHRGSLGPVSYTHLRAHETDSYLVCRLLLEKKKKKKKKNI